MDRAQIVARFHTLYLGDSLLERVVVEIGAAECELTFNAGKVLKHEGGSIFEPEAKFAPAALRFIGVRSIGCDGGPYQLNSTVVDFGAVAREDGDLIDFYLDLTGGADPGAFLVKLRFVASDFYFGAHVH